MAACRHPYLEKQLIAYIGNKRRLLPLIEAALRRCVPDGESGAGPLFVDFFSGSGSVARLAKLLGFSVIANDWEYYAAVLNRAFLTTGRTELAGLYPERGGIEKVLALLNTLPPPAPADRYISEYYCPRDTAAADPDRERLFYTRENGERIDAIRAWIEREYPGEQEEPRRRREKVLLLGLLLYEAATHANTSGVFKAYHRGFGGQAGDALGRIMGPVALEYPELIDGEAEVASSDAAELARRLAATGRRAQVAYLDPPYNQHQYGSNYHLLNTIARNDKPTLSREILQAGKKVEKGGIRHDWITTRSSYCYRKTAVAAFTELVSVIDARFLLVSYSTEGIIPFREMLEILGQRGRLDIEVAEYTRYRGGKQALGTTLHNAEFVLIADTEKRNRPEDTARLLKLLSRARIGIHLKQPVSPAVLIEEGFSVHDFTTLGERLVFRKVLAGLDVRVTVRGFREIVALEVLRGGRFVPVFELERGELAMMLELLGRITAVSREEELEVTLNHVRYLIEKGETRELYPLLPHIPLLLRKFNDRAAYVRSLEYLERVIALAGEIGRRADTPVAARRYARFLKALRGVVERKLVAGGKNAGNPALRERIRKSCAGLVSGAVLD